MIKKVLGFLFGSRCYKCNAICGWGYKAYTLRYNLFLGEYVECEDCD